MQARSTWGAGPYKQFWMRGVTDVVFSSVFQTYVLNVLFIWVFQMLQ
jgi:hypothetical protein